MVESLGESFTKKLIALGNLRSLYFVAVVTSVGIWMMWVGFCFIFVDR